MKEEIVIRAQALQQGVQELEEQLHFLDVQLEEFGDLKKIIDNKRGNDMNDAFSLVGKGVYMKSVVKENDFLVNVGGGIFIKKSSEELMSIIQKQMANLGNIKVELRTRYSLFL